MATMIKSGSDVVSFLETQHEHIKEMLEHVTLTTGKEKIFAFQTLRRMLAVHETAEEEIVHPVARRALPDGNAIVEARLKEEKHAKQTLIALEALNVDSAEFQTKFASFRQDVLGHATSEEQGEFEKLAGLLDESRLERMRRVAEFAESVAPTRPHPGVESATANMLVGPFASMLDRARDAISGKS